MPVETKTKIYKGAEFETFENERGELFFFRKSTLMRGKPNGPYRTAEEVRRPATLLTTENIAGMTGMDVRNVRYHIQQGNLRAVKRTWWLGSHRRSVFLVHMADLQEFMAKRAINKFHDKLIEWDVKPSQIPTI
jgi:hypothetical protein